MWETWFVVLSVLIYGCSQGTNQTYFGGVFLADFFYPEAVPNSQLLHHVFCVSIILKITYFIKADYEREKTFVELVSYIKLLWYWVILECFFFLCYLQLFLLAFVRSGFGMEDQGQIFKLRDGKGKSVYDVTHWFMHLNNQLSQRKWSVLAKFSFETL